MVKLTLHFIFVQKETSNLCITYITKLCAKYDAEERTTCMKLALLHSFLKKSIEVLAWKDKGIYNLVQFLLEYRFIIKVLNVAVF